MNIETRSILDVSYDHDPRGRCRRLTLASLSEEGIKSGIRSSSSFCLKPGRGVGGGMRYDMVLLSRLDMMDGRGMLDTAPGYSEGWIA